MRGILDTLAEHPTTLTLIGGAGSALFGAGFQLAWGNWTMAVWFAGILLSVGVPMLSARFNRLQQGRRAAQKCIKNALAACAAAHGLKSILSVPLFDPDNPDGPLLGTLQIDSDRTIAEMGVRAHRTTRRGRALR